MAIAPAAPGEAMIQLGAAPRPEAPAEPDRSFLVYGTEAQNQGIHQVTCSLEQASHFEHDDYMINAAYAQYMRMNKVLVGARGAEQLSWIYLSLKDEVAPRYLTAAGWAAADMALVQTNKSAEQRLSLLDEAVRAWRTALYNEFLLEQITPPGNIEYDTTHRIALNVAVSPLFAGIILGDVTPATCRSVFDNCLEIARLNIACKEAAAQSKNISAVSQHSGFGYECNAMLAFNRRFSSTWFAVPSMDRADSGYHHKEQTHDLLIIHQKYGVIRSATPVEIKAKASLRDRRRYDALLVRGKMHLSVDGKYLPEYTSRAIEAAYKDTANGEDLRIANNATNQFTEMVRDYYAGERIGKAVGRRTVTVFHDKQQVIARHPGLSQGAIIA